MPFIKSLRERDDFMPLSALTIYRKRGDVVMRGSRREVKGGERVGLGLFVGLG